MENQILAEVGNILAEFKTRHGAAALARVEEFVAVIAGMKTSQGDLLQQPNVLLFPRLTSHPWHDGAHFSQAKKLEAAHGTIRAAVLRCLVGEDGLAQDGSVHPERLRSAVEALDGETPNFLVPKHQARFAPAVRAMCDIFRMDCYEPTQVKLLVLPRGTRKPSRYCDDNLHLSFRLGLTGRGKMEAGHETRTWESGRCLVSDDSYRHTAWSEGDEEFGLMLIVRSWHPEMTETEIHALARLRAMMNAKGGTHYTEWQSRLGDEAREQKGH